MRAVPYHRFLATLSAHLTASLSEDLCGYFNISDERKNSIKSSPDPGLSLLLALDEIGVISQSEVEALKQPFGELKLVQAEVMIHEYQMAIDEEKNQLQRQSEVTEAGRVIPYSRFLAILSAHLTAPLSEDLCGYFNVSDERRNSITSSPDPRISLLLALDEIGVISQSEVEAVKQPFGELKLFQAEVMIHEYQMAIYEEKNQLQRQSEVTEAVEWLIESSTIQLLDLDTYKSEMITKKNLISIGLEQIGASKVEWTIESSTIQLLDLNTYKSGKFTKKNLVSIGSEQMRATKHEDVDVMTDLHKEQFIDEHGGTLLLCEADVSLDIPKGALKDGCVLHVTVPLNPRLFCPDDKVFPRTTPLIICEPDNLRFDKPVTLTIPHCAVLNYSRNHAVEVWFGHKTDNNSTEFTWLSETVEHSLGDHYCTVSLSHFCGVNVIIGSVKSKILRLIPYTKIEHSGKQVLTVWLCNDLEPDFKSVMQSEEKNKGIPLDSYDTFQLRCISGSENKVNVRIEVLEGSSWRSDETEAQVISVERLVTSSKTNCTFRLTSDVNDDGKYMYFLLRVTQGDEKEKTETAFAIRKRNCDLKMPANFMGPLSMNTQISHLHSTDTDASLRPYTAVVYMDPVNHFKDDVIITVWLWPFDSTTEAFKDLQREQELQYRHQVHTENSFSVVHEQPDVVTKTQLRNGHWVMSPKEMKIETDRIRFGSRAKFQFIGERDKSYETACIDLRVETYQVGEDVIRFMAEVELFQLLFETRQKEIEKLKASSASAEYTVSSLKDHSNKPQTHQSKQTGDDNIQPRKNEVESRSPDEHLKQCFVFLTNNVAGDWKHLGRCLKLVTEDDLTRLDKEHKDDIKEKIYQMLLIWKRKNSKRATPKELINALNTIDRTDLADILAESPFSS